MASIHCCSEIEVHLNDLDTPIIYIPKFREYGLKICDGGSSFQRISHCPWCGCQLSPSLRDIWFDELEALGLEVDSVNIPLKYRSDYWWLERLGLLYEVK